MSEDIAKIVEHLEYLGHTAGTPEEDGWIYVEHPRRFNFHMRAIGPGVRLHVRVSLGSQSLGDQRLEYLEFLNSANKRAGIASQFLDKGESGWLSIVACTILPTQYERKTYGVLLDLWRSDLDFLQRETPELRPENVQRPEETGGPLDPTTDSDADAGDLEPDKKVH